MRVTRGDNIAFFLLPGLTLLGLVATFVAGKIHSNMFPTVIAVTNKSRDNIRDISVTCSNSIQKISLVMNETVELKFPDCIGEIGLMISDVPVGGCSSGEDGFSRLEIEIMGDTKVTSKCKFDK